MDEIDKYKINKYKKNKDKINKYQYLATFRKYY